MQWENGERKRRGRIRVREERLVAWWRRQKDQEEGEGEARSENEEEEQCWVVFQVWRVTGHDAAAEPAFLPSSGSLKINIYMLYFSHFGPLIVVMRVCRTPQRLSSCGSWLRFGSVILFSLNPLKFCFDRCFNKSSSSIFSRRLKI